MFTKTITTAVFAIMVCLTGGTARADDKVENPLYKAWAGHNVGSSATYKAEIPDGNGGTKTAEITSMLKDKTDDSVTIETTAMGRTSSRTIPAKIDADDVKSAGDDEEVAAMDKKIKCKKVEVSPVADGETGKDKATLYTSDDVVGGLVKMVVPGPDGKEINVIITANDDKK